VRSEGGCMRAKVKNSRGSLVGLVGLVQPVGVRRLSDRTQPSRVGRVLVGLVGLVGLVRSRPGGPSHSIPNVPRAAGGHRAAPAAGAAAGGSSVVAAAPVAGATDHSPRGAGNRPTQKEPFRATIFRCRGLGYTPLPFERLRGAFLCVRARCPRSSSGRKGRVYVRLSAARAGSAARCPCRIRWCTWVVRSAGRGEGESHSQPCSGAHIGAQNLGAFS
jgi:hypothetical protein